MAVRCHAQTYLARRSDVNTRLPSLPLSTSPMYFLGELCAPTKVFRSSLDSRWCSQSSAFAQEGKGPIGSSLQAEVASNGQSAFSARGGTATVSCCRGSSWSMLFGRRGTRGRRFPRLADRTRDGSVWVPYGRAGATRLRVDRRSGTPRAFLHRGLRQPFPGSL